MFKVTLLRVPPWIMSAPSSYRDLGNSKLTPASLKILKSYAVPQRNAINCILSQYLTLLPRDK